MNKGKARALGILLGFATDRILGDPQRYHPVAGFGLVAASIERATYADTRTRGALYTAGLVGVAVGVGITLERIPGRLLSTAAVTWLVLGGRTLERETHTVAQRLFVHDLPGARRQVQRIVGRDTATLSAGEVARATVETLAENTADAVVAPLLWGAFAGAPGLLGYRAANTLDAMVGHRTSRYLNFGWASARLDDVLNLPGSRFAALLVIITNLRQARFAWAAWRADAARHPSPNAGVIEATFAGSLGIRLGGTNTYPSGTEQRAFMGFGPTPQTADIVRAQRLARQVGVAAAISAACIATVPRPRWKH